jgi:hypothetical protein
MSGPYTWGEMAKEAGDPTTIDDAIAAALAVHNASDNAHGQSSEAIYNHRIAEILDHLDDSVLPEHISADISYITTVAKDDDQLITPYDEWKNVGDLVITKTAAKVGRALVIANIYYAVTISDGEPIIRLKIVKAGVTSYYPDEYGWKLPYVPGVTAEYINLSTFTAVIDLVTGSNSAQVQALKSETATTFYVLGLDGYRRSYLNLITVGAAIT